MLEEYNKNPTTLPAKLKNRHVKDYLVITVRRLYARQY